MMFVLEMFFKESGSISSKITTKPIVRRQVFKFNHDSDQENFFTFHFLYINFLYFVFFSTNQFAPRIPCAVCGKFKSPNNQSHKRKVRLSSLRLQRRNVSAFVRLPIALAFSFISSLYRDSF